MEFITTVRVHYPDVPIILANLPDRMLTNIPALAQAFTKVYTFTIPFPYMQAGRCTNIRMPPKIAR